MSFNAIGKKKFSQFFFTKFSVNFHLPSNKEDNTESTVSGIEYFPLPIFSKSL